MASIGLAGRVADLGRKLSEGVSTLVELLVGKSKTGTIMVVTAREAIRQPIFVILLGIGCLVMLAFPFIPYFTFGEDVKMVKDMGLAWMLVLGLFFATLTASNTIAEDIEHRTAITLLSKPINRRQFIVGKFFGIILAVGVIFVIMGILFAVLLYYKVGYDARESAKQAPTSAEQWSEVWQVMPGLLLTYFQVVVLTALSVAISTRLPMVVNVVICFAIFFLGHLAPVLVQAAQHRPGEFIAGKMMLFTAQMAEVVLPALEFFNVGPAVATGSTIPADYVLWNFVYCILYSTVGILLAFVLFEDRDLA